MKRTMNTTVVVVCALVIALFTTSCSKDNDIPDAEKNAIQALNNIVGNYKGNLAATYGTTTTIWPGINWTVDKNSTITVNNFPSHTNCWQMECQRILHLRYILLSLTRSKDR